MKHCTLICDMQFGSTGKGLIAGYLAERDQPDVVVTQWSANAGHTYINDEGRKFVHCMIANGIVSPKLEVVMIAPGSQLNLWTLKEEIERCADLLKGKTIMIHENACVIQPKHIEEEAGPMTKIGSTKKGCGAALIEKIRRNPEVPTVIKDLSEEIIDLRYYVEHFGIKLRIVNTSVWNTTLHTAYHVQVEGAQGYSLGINSGFYPYVTSRECTPAQICSDCLISLRDVTNIVGTMRTYPIRVANRFDEEGNMVGYSGPYYPDQKEISFGDIGQEVEYTTVTKLPRRIFTFSRQQALEAIQIVRPDEIFLNFANYGDRVTAKIIEYVDGVCEIYNPSADGVKYVGYGPTRADVKELCK